MFFLPAARRQLEAEIAAQFQAFAATGLALDHVNAHKHFQMHPTIAGLILKVGARHGLKSARAPFEPAGVLNAVEPGAARRRPSPFGLMARGLRARFRRAGLRTPDQVFGLRWSGAMSMRRLRGLIERLPAGLTEIYLHPAVTDHHPGAAPGYRHAEEAAALIAPEVLGAVARAAVRVGGFADFLPGVA
jgi:hopanoid biosynthesis associated protein HpnK